VICLEHSVMKVRLDISAFWPRASDGALRSVNSVYEDIRGSSNEVGRNTLRLALDGRFDRGHFDNLIKLARLCSLWSGRQVSPDELLIIDDEEKK
jgi:hypothetical protein